MGSTRDRRRLPHSMQMSHHYHMHETLLLSCYCELSRKDLVWNALRCSSSIEQRKGETKDELVVVGEEQIEEYVSDSRSWCCCKMAGQAALYIHKGRRPRPNPVEQAENSTHWPVINNRASHRPTSPTRRSGRVSFKETITKIGQSGKMASIDHHPGMMNLAQPPMLYMAGCPVFKTGHCSSCLRKPRKA